MKTFGNRTLLSGTRTGCRFGPAKTRVKGQKHYYRTMMLDGAAFPVIDMPLFRRLLLSGLYG